MTSVYNIEFSIKHSIDINVENLSYVIDQPNITTSRLPCHTTDHSATTKTILDGVSFQAKCGQMLAIMGSSGSGKTSLLNVLACKNSTGTVTGDIELNGVKHTKHMIEHFSAYVRQDDRLLQFLSVKETLMFVAQLKLPTKLSRVEIVRKVDEVIAELGLSHVTATRVGGANIRGISGGERRRVSIGIQLLMDPSILLLDEPTSGLDSFTAHHLIQTLSRLAKNQRTILLSIHQPRSDIFELFDKVLVLSVGQTVYYGETRTMVDYFTRLGYPCPELTNPSDYYMDLATIDATTDETESRTTEVVENLLEAYRRQGEEVHTGSDTEVNQHIKEYMIEGATEIQVGYPGFFHQFTVLARRHFKNTVINQWALIVQTFEAVFMSLVLGVVFWELTLDQRGIRDRYGFMFMITMMYPFTNTLDVIGQCHEERKYLYFELEDKLYGYFAYYFSKIIAELPFHFLFVSLYFTPAYFMTGLQVDVIIFFTMFGIVLLLVYVTRSWALAMAMIFPNYTLSSTVSNILLALFSVCSGFYVNLESMHSGTRWMADVSPIRWAFDSLSLVEYGNVTFACGQIDPRYCIKTGEEALKLYGFDGDQVWMAVVILLGNICGYQLMAILAFRFIPQKPYGF
ncbi:hypothetical protein LOTGIDRAFT_128489 [Lottia gigantea]|uniref:ABC transporter domain-containing protein n=1 Tax=Lottia gigantea TaxID=225164 RepID=V3ZQX3_LOTGI|nr:hypothetical protein LOTGIDRAFT_128489 [Lottia gigantea]ESO86757.1 hypothetical protein LOTGIDRAFT_128489 [Lottia gigantea]